MVKIISQETFDAVVKENIEEFGLDAEEATKDAVEQFKAQGVSLSNIVTSGHRKDDKSHLVIKALESIDKILQVESSQDDTENEMMKSLKDVEDECNIDLARRILAENNQAFSKIMRCIKRFPNNQEVKLQSLKSMAALTQGYPDIVTVEGLALTCDMLEQECFETISVVLSIMRNCCKMHEKNREAFMTDFHLASKLRRLLETSSTRTHSVIVVRCCQLIRTIVSDDDVRVEFGRTHEYACMIAKQENGLELLTSLLTEYEDDHEVISELLPTLSRLAVRNEFCQQIVEFGGLKFVSNILFRFYEDKELVESSLSLIKALAGNDDVKNAISKVDGIQLITAALDRHKAIASVADMGCAAVGALCLRTPDNSAGFVASGIAPLMMDVLKIHKLKVAVQRQVSMAIRNIVSRRRDLSVIFLEAGAEELLRDALKRSQRAPANEIKAALRDLGCEVQLEEQWTGKGVSVTN